MKRPCHCDGLGRECRMCFLYRTSPEHRRMFEEMEALPEDSQVIITGPAPTLVHGGPGSELKKLLAELGVTPKSGCGCNSKAALMDSWGVELCQQRRDTIIAWLREGKAEWQLGTVALGALNALVSGLAFHLNPFDPIPGLVDEAIRRASRE